VDVKERLTPEDAAGPGLTAAEHVHRYAVAAVVCEGLRVADVGCGVGYGSSLLRESCPAVLGVDIDEGAIQTARKLFGRDSLEFEQGDATEFLRGTLDDLDAIVLFETLEHLDNTEQALEALRSAARSGLRIIISIPNSKAFDESNAYHHTEFGFDEAMRAFESFDDVVVLDQFHAEASLIQLRGTAATDVRAVLRRQGEPEYANHFIGCVNLRDRLGSSHLSARVDIALSAYQSRYMLGLERANAELRRANVQLARKRIGMNDSAAATILSRVEALQAELEETREQLRVCVETRISEEQIRSLHEHIAEQQETISYMQGTRVWKIGARYWRTREALRRRIGRH